MIQVNRKQVTPDLAKKWLDSNIKINRKLDERLVHSYYQQMVKGQWMETGDTIKFSKSGKLMNGQHTLHAIIKYGKPVALFVAEGLDEEAFMVLDTGKTRSASDALHIAGFKNNTNLAATVKQILLWEAGYYANPNVRSKASNSDVIDFVEKNPEISEVITFINTLWKHFRYVSASTLAMLYWVLSRKNQQQADDFFGKLSSGADLGVENPIRHLREKLMRDSLNKSRLKAREKVALFIFAWNAHLQKKRMSQLTLQRNYIFPRPL